MIGELEDQARLLPEAAEEKDFAAVLSTVHFLLSSLKNTRKFFFPSSQSVKMLRHHATSLNRDVPNIKKVISG